MLSRSRGCATGTSPRAASIRVGGDRSARCASSPSLDRSSGVRGTLTEDSRTAPVAVEQDLEPAQGEQLVRLLDRARLAGDERRQTACRQTAGIELNLGPD